MEGTSLLWLLFVTSLLSCATNQDFIVQQTQPGENVTLRCQVDGGVSIRAAEWTRDDLETPEYVLSYSNGRSDPTNQHPSFKGRVELVDSELKDGDVSLILRSVRVNDSGTYECRVTDGRSGHNKINETDADPIRRVQLNVTDSGSKEKNPTDGNDNFLLTAGLKLFSSVASALVFVCFIRRCKRCLKNRLEEPADQRI